MNLRFTLRADGPSDALLLPILRWALLQELPEIELHEQFANPKSLPREKSKKLAASIRSAIDYYPCELLFVHRDAEAQDPEVRHKEIREAMDQLSELKQPYICVVPIRMSEAWLLIDKESIRKAAGNPNGKIQFEIPPLKGLEHLPDPKQLCRDLMRTASELRGRRLKSFLPDESIPLIARYIQDFSPLKKLSAFQSLQRQIAGFSAEFRSRSFKGNIE